jgi:hypothetical protein
MGQLAAGRGVWRGGAGRASLEVGGWRKEREAGFLGGPPTLNSTTTPVALRWKDTEKGSLMVTEMDVGAEEAVERDMQEEEEKGDRCDFIFCELLPALCKHSLYLHQDALSLTETSPSFNTLPDSPLPETWSFSRRCQE